MVAHPGQRKDYTKDEVVNRSESTSINMDSIISKENANKLISLLEKHVHTAVDDTYGANKEQYYDYVKGINRDKRANKFVK